MVESWWSHGGAMETTWWSHDGVMVESGWSHRGVMIESFESLEVMGTNKGRDDV